MSNTPGTNRSRAWCFTCNNYTDDDIKKFQEFPSEYLIYGEEVGKEGTPHLQGFIYFASQRTLNGLKKKLHPTAHFESARDIPASIEYCKKDGKVYEQGVPPRQGKRTDMEGIHKMLQDRTSMKDIADSNFTAFCQFHKAYDKYFQLLLQPRPLDAPPPEVIWIFGSSGTGKTRHVFTSHPQSEVYVKPPGQWFDGYVQQPVVLLDDFDPSHMCFRNLLHLLDRYPHQVPVKGSFVNFYSKTIYITSDRHPKMMYNNPHELKQLERRITKLIYSDEDIDHFVSRTQPL